MNAALDVFLRGLWDDAAHSSKDKKISARDVRIAGSGDSIVTK